MTDKPGDYRERVLGAIRDAIKGDKAHLLEPDTPPVPDFGVEHLARTLAEGDNDVVRIRDLDEVAAMVSAKMREWDLGDRIAVSEPSLLNLDWGKNNVTATDEWDEGLKAALTLSGGSIAETGQVLVSGKNDEARFSLLADTHFVVVDTKDMRPSLDHIGDMLGDEPDGLVTLIAGPSRTADIEQTIVMGAHGPRRVCVLLMDSQANGDLNATTQ